MKTARPEIPTETQIRAQVFADEHYRKAFHSLEETIMRFKRARFNTKWNGAQFDNQELADFKKMAMELVALVKNEEDKNASL